MRNEIVLRCAVLVLLLAGLTGCQSFTAAHPLVIAPTSQDWSSAFAKLNPEEQKVLEEGTGFIVVPTASSRGAIYRARKGSPSEPIDFQRLDLAAIADGYNKSFRTNPADRWEVGEAMTQVLTGSLNGIQNQTYELNWKFKDSAERNWAASGSATGVGVEIEWGTKESDLARDANVAFAHAFLRLMLRSKTVRRNVP